MMDGEPESGGEGSAPSVSDAGLTRRQLMQVVGGSLLGSAVLGNATDVSQAALADGSTPSPGSVNWSEYIEDPQVVGENVEPPHAPTMPYASLSAARDAERRRAFLTEQWLESKYVQSLNGAWKFHIGDSLDGAATDTSNSHEWESVYVPHTWQMDGYGDLEYHASGTGFEPNDPPNVPTSNNRVGTYKREFPIPDGWTADRQTFLEIGAAKAGYFVWVNDDYVGYKQGSMTPGEFNVTDAVQSGTNTVTIQVVRWTDGTYLEQQDMWRFAGIFRDVLVYSKPDVCIRDVNIDSDLDSTYTDGTLEIDVAIANYSDERRPSRGPPEEKGDSGNSRTRRNVMLRAHLYDPSDTEIRTAEQRITVRSGSVVSLDSDSTDGVHDLSREANDATIEGDPKRVNGFYGTALDFDGSEDWVDAGNDASLDVTGSITVEAVVKLSERSADTVPIVAKGDSQYALRLEKGTPQFAVHDGSTRHSVTAASDHWTGWHRIAGVYDGSTLRLYIDGNEVGTASHSGGIRSTDASVGIAHDTQSKYGDVTIDSVRIYDRALSAGEIASERTVPSHSTRLWLDFEEIQSGSASPITMDLRDVETWSAEEPSLYTLGLELLPNGSKTVEALVEKVGFRKFEIQPAADGTGDAIHVNGKRVTLAGTNCHSLSLDHGRHAPLERVRKEIELAKQHNVNALRTSHYPHRPDFYRLADEYGIYIQDEVNAEVHGNQSLVEDDYRFDPSFFDRFYRMVERDKNFTSIDVWSTGNEAGEGPAHEFMAEYVRERDGTRHLTHQDNGGGYGAGFGGTAPFADLNGIRWSTPEDVAEMAEDGDLVEPIAMGEYAPVEGNAGGLLPDFGDVIHEHDQIAGGYVWMWNHHSLNSTTPPTDDGVLTEPHRRGAVNDQSIAGQTAMIRGGPSTTSGPSGTALDLDGSDDWIDANDDDRIDITGEITVEAVVYGTTPSEGYDPIVTKGESQYALRFNGGDLEFVVHDGSTHHSVTAALPSGWSESWHAVTGVYDGAALRLYVDGTELAATSYAGRIHSNRYRVAVGHNTERPDRYAALTIDSVRIFERALSPDEIDAESPDDSTRLWLDFEVVEHFWSAPYGTTHHAPSGTIHDDRYTLPTIDVMKKSYQFVRFSANELAEGTLEISNQYHFTNLDAFDVEWELTEDDTVIQHGTLDLDVPPGETRPIDVGFDRPELQAGADYFLDVSVKRTSETDWAPAGHEVAFEQFEIPWDVPDDPAVALSEMESVSYTSNESEVVVAGSGFTYVFDTSAGRFTSFQRNGNELLERGPQLNAWREPVRPNETSSWGHTEADDFVAAGLDEMTASVQSTEVSQPDDSAIRIDVKTVDSADGNGAAFTTTYRYHVLGSGDVVVRLAVEPNVDLMVALTSYVPRLGLQVLMPEEFDQFEWYGRGPGESYPDKKRHQRVGRYTGSVADQFEPYLPPGDYGNKCDTRYAALTDGSGVGLLVHDLPGTELMNVSVQAFTNMREADHHYQLQPADGVVFNVDYAVSGVGGIPNGTRPPYRIDPTEHAFVYAFRPFDASEDPLQLSKRSLPFSGPPDPGESGPIQERSYWIENVNSHKAMDVTADSIDQNGANVLQWRYQTNGNQQWAAVRNDDITERSSVSSQKHSASGDSEEQRSSGNRPQADDDTYRFVNVQSRKVLAVDSASTDDGANVVQGDWDGGDEQRWRVVETDDDTYRIENINSGYVLAVSDGSTENGASVVQTEWTSGDHQEWRFNPL